MLEHPFYILAIVLVIVAFGGGGWLYRKAFLRGKKKAEQPVTTPGE